MEPIRFTLQQDDAIGLHLLPFNAESSEDSRRDFEVPLLVAKASLEISPSKRHFDPHLLLKQPTGDSEVDEEFPKLSKL